MRRLFFFIIVAVAFYVAYTSYFIVGEVEQVIVTRFGKPVSGPITQAGIHFKIPVIDKAYYYDKRILEWDGDTSQPIPTKDNKNIQVDVTARWKIVEPLVFLQTIGDEESAHSRLDDILDSNVRDVISRHDLIELVRNSNRVIDVLKSENALLSSNSLDLDDDNQNITLGREKTTREILKKSQAIMKKYGIELIDVRIKGLIYSPAVLETIYQSMVTQYDIKAQNLRSEGDRKKAEIEGDTELEVKRILSESYRKSNELRGQGESEALAILQDAVGTQTEFYTFLKKIEALKASVTDKTKLILSSDAEVLDLLK